MIKSYLGTEYETVAEATMWEIGLIVLAHHKHKKYTTNVEVPPSILFIHSFKCL